MDFCLNEQDQQVFSSPALTAPYSPLDDLFPPQNMEVDVSLECQSVFVEDCLTSPGNCLPPAAAPTTRSQVSQTSTTTPNPPKPKSLKNATNCLEKLFVVPGKARSKRKRVISAKVTNPLTSWSYGHNQPFYFTSSDPPLLHQTHWLADSELIMPKNQTNPKNSMKKQEEQIINEEVIRMSGEKTEEMGNVGNKENGGLLQQLQAPRRCTHCQSQRTPQWRAGPLGPKTLCNACGVRYKSGRLLPEYRPAKSPTFVSYLHSNSHKKVLEMRNMASTTTDTTTSPESSILS